MMGAAQGFAVFFQFGGLCVGNTAQGRTEKQVTLETGATLNVPMFIEEGEMVTIRMGEVGLQALCSWSRRRRRHAPSRETATNQLVYSSACDSCKTVGLSGPKMKSGSDCFQTLHRRLGAMRRLRS